MKRVIASLFKKAFCKHSSKKLVKTDLVLSHHVCEECGKDIVEPYNGFKEMSKHGK
jgi:ribosomal protein L32